MPTALAARIRAANAAILTAGRLDAIPEFFASDHVAHVTARDGPSDHAAIARFVRALRRAFADLEVEVDVFIEKGDRVAWQRTLTGTHVAAFAGFPATEKKTVWRDMVTSRFADGLIAEEWVVSDLAERLLRARSH